MAKYKAPAPGVKKLLSGKVDSIHGIGTKETKRKVEQSQCYNPRQAPIASGQPPRDYAKRARYAEQPSSGE